MRKMLLGLVVALTACGDNYDTEARVDATPHNGDAPVAIDAPTTADAPPGIDAPLTAQILTPSPYTSRDDSPFKNLGTWYVEDFEDHLLDDVPGVTDNGGTSTRSVAIPQAIDSVDGDDGTIDGQCPSCDSWFVADVKFEAMFSPVDGSLPTHVGVVWTDAGSPGATVTFEAFDAQGGSLGTSSVPNLSDSSNLGTTGEDRFFGAVSPTGVARITVTNSAGAIEIDHLQWAR